MFEACLTINDHLNLISSSSGSGGGSMSVSLSPDNLVQQYSRDLKSAVTALLGAINVQQDQITMANNAILDALLEEGFDLGQGDNIKNGYAVATAAAAAVSTGHKHFNLDALNKLIAYYNSKYNSLPIDQGHREVEDSKKVAELFSLIENRELEILQQREQYEFRLRETEASALRDKQVMQQQVRFNFTIDDDDDFAILIYTSLVISTTIITTSALCM